LRFVLGEEHRNTPSDDSTSIPHDDVCWKCVVGGHIAVICSNVVLHFEIHSVWISAAFVVYH